MTIIGIRYVLLSLLCIFCTIPVSAKVSVTEIQYNPPGSDTGFEWIEVVNEGPASVIFTDFRLKEGGSTHRLKEVSASELVSDAVAVIVQDTAKFESVHPEYNGPLFLSSFSLRQKNGLGEVIGIVNAEGAVDSEVFYAPDERSDGTGATLHITLEGSQIAAPATPGTIAINPITARAAAEETIEKETAAEEVAKSPVIPNDAVGSISVEKEIMAAVHGALISDTVPSSGSVQWCLPSSGAAPVSPDYTALLIWIAAALTAVFVSLLFLCILLSLCLYSRRSLRISELRPTRKNTPRKYKI